MSGLSGQRGGLVRKNFVDGEALNAFPAFLTLRTAGICVVVDPTKALLQRNRKLDRHRPENDVLRRVEFRFAAVPEKFLSTVRTSLRRRVGGREVERTLVFFRFVAGDIVVVAAVAVVIVDIGVVFVGLALVPEDSERVQVLLLVVVIVGVVFVVTL